MQKHLVRLGQGIARVSPPWLRTIGRVVWKPFGWLHHRIKQFLARRPHRSFRLTRRRDYKRSFKMPGYWAFTAVVFKKIWSNKKLFGGLILLYTLLYILVAGFGAQEAYVRLSDTLKEAGGDLFAGAWGQFGQAALLLTTTFTTGISPNPTEVQGVLMTLLGFLMWLTVVWLLRNILAGHRVKLRDGLYNSGSPLVSTVLVGLIMALQLLPIAILILVYNAAEVSGILDSGIEAMLVWVVAIFLIVLTLYWLTGSLIALVIVTLPGMYPFEAIRAAGDLVVGRRIRILYRFLWMVLLVALAWIVIVIPIILFDSWLKSVAPGVAWLPLVPIVIMLMSAATLVWVSSYVYLLYRRIVADDADPV